ncbi:MAG TPA: hypothetical protein VMS17_30740 [Gemmataceae bacterium]|nr:hypothetical protein [Gemmataceae bacterium]
MNDNSLDIFALHSRAGQPRPAAPLDRAPVDVDCDEEERLCFGRSARARRFASPNLLRRFGPLRGTGFGRVASGDVTGESNRTTRSYGGVSNRSA